MAFGVVGHANESARHVTFELVARGEICRVRPAESQRDSEPLRITDRYVRAEFARRFQQCESKNICCDDDQCTGVVCLSDEISVIVLSRHPWPDIEPARRKLCRQI